MASHGMTTVEELRRAYRYLLTEIRLSEPVPFVSGDPANERRLTLDLAILVRDVVDITGQLRSARLVLDLAERGIAYERSREGMDVLAPLAPILVIPESAIAASGIPEAELLAFFTSQDVLAIPFSA